jgi:hypothetical protein
MDFPMSVMEADLWTRPMFVNYFWQQCLIGVHDALGHLPGLLCIKFREDILIINVATGVRRISRLADLPAFEYIVMKHQNKHFNSVQKSVYPHNVYCQRKHSSDDMKGFIEKIRAICTNSIKCGSSLKKFSENGSIFLRPWWYDCTLKEDRIWKRILN